MIDAAPTSTRLLPSSTPNATPESWSQTCSLLAEQATYWLATVRSDGRPHVVPVLAVVMDQGMVFCTFASSQKASNLGGNGHCVITSGADGCDVVLEGVAKPVQEPTALGEVGSAFANKYGWQVEVEDAVLWADSGSGMGAIPWSVYLVEPSKSFAFTTRDGGFAGTRWTF